MSGDGYNRTYKSGAEKRKQQKLQQGTVKTLSNAMMKYLQVNLGDDKTNEHDTEIVTETVTILASAPDSPDVECKESLQLLINNESTAEVVDNYSEQSEAEPSHDESAQVSNSTSTSNQQKIQQPEPVALKFSKDPADWVINADLLQHIASNLPSQNSECDFAESGRWFGESFRYAQVDYFTRILANGEKVKREWLVYSSSTGNVYCFVCKLFSSTSASNSNQFQSGFADWKNATSRITSHEISKSHLAAVKVFIEMQGTRRIDVGLVQQIEHERRYWVQVLHRVVAVISFLAERGLAFRGDSETIGCSSNGNYLGCIELVAKFDPFLSDICVNLATQEKETFCTCRQQFVMNSLEYWHRLSIAKLLQKS